MILKSKNFLILALLVFCISCNKKEQESFTFVQLSDTQLGQGGYEHDVASFKQAVEQINTLNPDFVIICGDLVKDPVDSAFTDFIEIMNGLNMTCYCVAGNHDIGNAPNDTTLNYYRETLGKDYYEFQNKGYSFIVTNSQLWKVDVENESDKHDSWFKETLKKQSVKQQPLIIVGHFPLYTELPDEEEHYFNFPLTKRQEMLTLFQQNNVLAYLSGHLHRGLVHNYKNIQLVSGEPTSKGHHGSPLGFRLWDVSSDTLIHQFIALETEVIMESENVSR